MNNITTLLGLFLVRRDIFDFVSKKAMALKEDFDSSERMKKDIKDLKEQLMHSDLSFPDAIFIIRNCFSNEGGLAIFSDGGPPMTAFIMNKYRNVWSLQFDVNEPWRNNLEKLGLVDFVEGKKIVNEDLLLMIHGPKCTDMLKTCLEKLA